jgi:hypothetical protein
MAIPTGLNVVVHSQGGTANSQYVRFIGYGTYTAADFTIGAEATYTNPNAPTVATQLTYGGLGFVPTMVKVYNLTDGTGAVAVLNSNLTVDGYTQAAAGDKTATATNGISVSGKQLIVDVSVAGPLTDNDDFVIECWG